MFFNGRRLWEMVTRKRVWEGQLTSVFDKVERGERPPLPENSVFCELIAKCWAQGMVGCNMRVHRFRSQKETRFFRGVYCVGRDKKELRSNSDEEINSRGKNYARMGK